MIKRSNPRIKTMKVLFLGTPDFAIPSLRAIRSSSHEILAVITQPDKEGRRRVMTPPAVKVEAEKMGLPIYQFDSLRKEGVDLVRSLAPDVMVTAAFGQILSQELLDIPKYGVFNVHGSLLPKYRGASPIQSCLLAGDDVTGVTIMRTAYEVDSGDVILKKELPISPEDDAGSLFDKLAALGAEGIVQALDLLEKGAITYTPQDHSQATFCKMIRKSDAEITSITPLSLALNMARAYSPWPIVYVTLGEERLRLFGVEAAAKKGETGTFRAENGELFLELADGALHLVSVQAEGKKQMSGRDYLIGHRSVLDKRIG